MKRFRPLAVMFLTTFVIFFLSRGRGYYTAPAYVMLLAAGSVWLENWLGARSGTMQRAGFGLLSGMLATGGLLGLVVSKPTVPVNSPLWEPVIQVNGEFVEMIGWPDLTAQVAEIYRSIPANEKPRTVILAGNYGEAGALDLYGREIGLPPVISSANSLWVRGYGTFEPETVIVVGFERGYADQFFASCDFAGTVTNAYGVKNEESSRHTSLYVCRQPRRSWIDLWKEMQWFQ